MIRVAWAGGNDWGLASLSPGPGPLTQESTHLTFIANPPQTLFVT